MLEGIFYKLGKITYRFRWAIILLWAILLVACLPFLPNFMAPFKNTCFKDPHSESALAATYINQKINYNSNRIVVLYHSDQWRTDEPRFQDEIKNSLKKLKQFPTKNKIIYPDRSEEHTS